MITMYRFYRSEKDNQYNFLKLFKLFLSFFQVPKISLLFVWFKRKLQLTVLLIFCFMVNFSKGKSRIFGEFYCSFLSGL